VSLEDITTALGRVLDTDTRLIDPTLADIGALYAFTQAVNFDIEARPNGSSSYASTCARWT
jgi:hypothetical protein